jgi:hypothetical protein
LTIQIANDALSEGTETILLSLSANVDGPPVTLPAQATVFIIDDDDGMLEINLALI